MDKQSRIAAGVVACMMVCLAVGSLESAARYSQTESADDKGAAVTTHATGTFDVKLAPVPFDDKPGDAGLGRMLIDKQFHGDLEATSRGQMLSAGTGGKGSSGGYVALERVTGKLNGREGSFVLQQSGTMTRGTPQMSITVVPDSGTGQLVGLAGTMMIKIDNGKHSYDFEYTLAKTP